MDGPAAAPPPEPALAVALEQSIVAVLGIGLAIVVGGIAATVAPLPWSAHVVRHSVINAVVTLGVVAWLLERYRQPWRSLGFRPMRLGRLLARIAIGFVLFVGGAYLAALVYLLATQTSPSDLREPRLDLIRQMAQLGAWQALLVSLLAGVSEEVVVRGMVLTRVRTVLRHVMRRDSVATVVAIVFSAALFGAQHGYQGAAGVAQTTGIGVVLGALALRWGLWPCIGIHALWDAMMFTVARALAGG